ncbi:MAG: hypothetical protein CVV44_15100 [Spirochaetae bacterium HGW-Spirochaetae-1]|jgi:hypothetical protein|nr:MAG: hypothetical protein CVV44_15100 [Spirochaetae bacterium HGW-Spirochaetae-1]
MDQKKVAILQSNYIPWKGYFDLINMVDEFILYDDVQYTKNDWRNRNRIKTVQGVQWLSIPVFKESLSQKIKDTKIIQQDWNKKHWKTIKINYAKAQYFKDYSDNFENAYMTCTYKNLSAINYSFIKAINNILGITTKISFSSEYSFKGDKTEKIISILKEAKATEYLSGPAARDYIDENLFQQEGITLAWMNYSGYREYTQLYPPFEHAVSVIDLIFNEGPKANRYLKSFKEVI